MKIFANNFALSLSLREGHPHFRFARTPLKDVKALLDEEHPFPDLQIFTDAEAHEDFIRTIFEIHTQPSTAGVLGTWNLIFETNEEIESFFHAYQSRYHAVAAAGGLVLGTDNTLLTMVRDEMLDLPKGKVEKGESWESAALREVEEETGIGGLQLLSLADKTYHIYLRKGRWDFKTTYWFWMKGDPESAGTLRPQVEEGITHLEWSMLEGLKQNVPQTYPQIMSLIRKAVFEGPKYLQA